MSEYFDMGEFSFYIWASYAVVFALLAGTMVVTLKQMKKASQQVKALRPKRKKNDW